MKHGHAGGKSREYHSWRSMRSRCLNPNDPAFDRYGGRGIGIDPRWDSFANFLADMGPRPEGMTLDREDNNGDYAPGNCRWATPLEQQSNTRTTNLITARGVTQCLTAWARDLGMDPAAIRHRITKMGMSPEVAVTTPKLPPRGRRPWSADHA